MVGADGHLGSAVAERLRRRGCDVIATSRRPGARDFLDLESAGDWRPPRVEGAWLLAGATGLAQCKLAPEATRAVNVRATLCIADRLHRSGAFVVFPSTNVVFDGTRPFVDAGAGVGPTTEYGRQKAEVEREILAAGGGILRLTKVLHHRVPLIERWRQQLLRGAAVRAFRDMVMAPVPLSAAVEALLWVGLERRAGIHQLSASDDIPYVEAARFLARRWSGADAPIEECSWRDEPGVVEPPPRHTTLAVTAPLTAGDPAAALSEAAET